MKYPGRPVTTRRRLDLEMVRRGLSPSREQAQTQVAEGLVLVKGAPATKSAHLVGADEPIEIHGPPPRFVGRGGVKLDAALDVFPVAVEGRRCLDAGASTGGFTDCLLQRGASEVVAVDVGYGQLHERLRGDPRVTNLERTNIRGLVPDDIGGPCSLIVADLSFISLRVVLPTLMGLLDPGPADEQQAAVGAGAQRGSELVVLVKPQFEAGRREVSRGKGVVRDPEVWRQVLEEIEAACHEFGAVMMGAMVSPITGAGGNVEFLVHVRGQGAAIGRLGEGSLHEVLDEVLDEARRRFGN